MAGASRPHAGPPGERGEFYVIERDRPADAPRITLDLPDQSRFDPASTLTVTGRSTARTVRYAAVIPGAVIDQGEIEVRDGRFTYGFDPAKVHQATPTYDVVSLKTGKPDIKEVVHLTFFSRETAPDGRQWHSFVRAIIRGDTVLYVR